jgi:hypothetical protein
LSLDGVPTEHSLDSSWASPYNQPLKIGLKLFERSCAPTRKPRACWCLTYRLPNAENGALVGSARAELMRSLCADQPAPEALAYIDESPAGWCAVGPRAAFARLTRSKTIPVLDEVPVWSIVCLVVKSGFRHMGVARELIRGAVRYAGFIERSMNRSVATAMTSILLLDGPLQLKANELSAK